MFAVLPLVDRAFGTRIEPQNVAGRLMSRVVPLGVRLTPVRWTGPIQFVFQTRLGERAVTGAILGATVLLVTVLIGTMAWRTGQVRLDGWRYFDDGPSAVRFDPAHYRESGDGDGQRPTIDAQVISGPYLRLYVPYRPRRHNPLLDEQCPLTGLAAEAMKTSASCLGALHTIRLDGVALAGLTWDFTRDTASQFVGVVAFIDVRAVSTGRHELAIDAPGRNATSPRIVTVIPFYR